jgi:hypothetical protein
LKDANEARKSSFPKPKAEGLRAKERSQTAMDGPSKARMNREDGRTGDLKVENQRRKAKVEDGRQKAFEDRIDRNDEGRAGYEL